MAVTWCPDTNSANDIIFFSSRGPCRWPDQARYCCPRNTHVPVVYILLLPLTPDQFRYCKCLFQCGGVCAGPGLVNFFPATAMDFSKLRYQSFLHLPQQDLVPDPSGLYQQGLTPASPALTKGNDSWSASWMNGVGAGDNLFSNNQGMGRVNMNNYFDVMTSLNWSATRWPADMFTASGQTKEFCWYCC